MKIKIIDNLQFRRAVYIITTVSKMCPRGWIVAYLMPNGEIKTVFFGLDDYRKKSEPEIFCARINKNNFEGFQQNEVEEVLRSNLWNLGYIV